ncbi:MAG: cyclic pyranopterin monophosphate synthase MoaC [Brooklawnia sp.]|nr:cyclic pyranopterin monophosphate synthase MoaC [Brooklawnia sp.]
MSGLSHLRSDGSAHMVDVTGKQVTARQATAIGRVSCAQATVASLRDGSLPKGDVLAVARIAGIAAAKRTPELLPLAHVIGMHGCEIDLELLDDGVLIQATVRTADRTGVEMEALTAVTVAALAIVDMIKGLDRTAAIRDAMIVAKSGGRSGNWRRPLDELPEWAFEN